MRVVGLLSAPPPAVPVAGRISAKLSDVAFSPALADAVSKLQDAWKTYPDLPISGYDRADTIDAALATGDVRNLSAAVAAILDCLSTVEVDGARFEIAAEKREREYERQRRNDERAAQRRKERAQKRGESRFYHMESRPYYSGMLATVPSPAVGVDAPPRIKPKRGGDRKSGRSKYNVVFPFYDQLKRKMPDSEDTEAFLIKVINRFRQRRPHLISRVGLTADRKGAERLRSALKRRSPKTTVVNATKNAKPSDESKVVSTDKSTI
jgi:hypothetical protein